MTEAQARTTANVVLAAAVIGAAYYVLKTPPLRRRVWHMARLWVAGPVAAWTATEIRRAWDESASARSRSSAGYGARGSDFNGHRGSAGYDGAGPPPPATDVQRATARQAVR
jgi:hypothetical protein